VGQGLRTHYFENKPNVFDPFLVNKNFLKQAAPIRILEDSVEILRFGDMGKPVDPSGFSDHYPIAIKMIAYSRRKLPLIPVMVATLILAGQAKSTQDN
jgi:hypothetical protein